jgi:hypothetical protein
MLCIAIGPGFLLRLDGLGIAKSPIVWLQESGESQVTYDAWWLGDCQPQIQKSSHRSLATDF